MLLSILVFVSLSGVLSVLNDNESRSLQNQGGGQPGGGQTGGGQTGGGQIGQPGGPTGSGGVSPPILPPIGGGVINPSLPVLNILTTPLNSIANFERGLLLSSGVRYIGFPRPTDNSSPCIVLGLYRFIALQGGVANSFEIRAVSNSRTLSCKVTATLFEFVSTSSTTTTTMRAIGALDAIGYARPELYGAKPGSQALTFAVVGKNWKFVSGRAYGISLLTSTYPEGGSRNEFCSVSIFTAADYNVTATNPNPPVITTSPEKRGYLQSGSASPSSNSAANNGICISSIDAFYAPPVPRLLKLDGYHLLARINAIDTASIATPSPSPSTIPAVISDKIGSAASVSPPTQQQDSSSSSIFVYIYAIAGGVAGAFILGMAFVYAIMRNAEKSPISSIDPTHPQQPVSADELDPRVLDTRNEWGTTSPAASRTPRHFAVEIASGQRSLSTRASFQPRVVVNPLNGAQNRNEFSPQSVD